MHFSNHIAQRGIRRWLSTSKPPTRRWTRTPWSEMWQSRTMRHIPSSESPSPLHLARQSPCPGCPHSSVSAENSLETLVTSLFGTATLMCPDWLHRVWNSVAGSSTGWMHGTFSNPLFLWVSNTARLSFAQICTPGSWSLTTSPSGIVVLTQTCFSDAIRASEHASKMPASGLFSRSTLLLYHKFSGPCPGEGCSWTQFLGKHDMMNLLIDLPK